MCNLIAGNIMHLMPIAKRLLKQKKFMGNLRNIRVCEIEH